MDPRYPIGRFEYHGAPSEQDVENWIADIEALPEVLRTLVGPLMEGQFEATYRPGGWTIRQVVHHLADSHMNSYVRFKLALTEDNPTIRPYFEDRWAELADYRATPVSDTLDLIEHLHRRWTILLRSLTPEELNKTFMHPESGPIQLAWNIGNYAWHGNHHLAHIRNALDLNKNKME